MKTLTITLILSLFYINLFSTVYETRKNGDFTNKTTWENNIKPTIYYGGTDTIIIKHDVTNTSAYTIYGTFIVNSGASYTSSNTLTLGDFSKFTNNGEVEVNLFNSAWNSITFTNNGSISVNTNIDLRRGTYLNTGLISAANRIKIQSNITFTNSATGTILAASFENHYILNNDGSISVSGVFLNDWGHTVNNTGSIIAGDSLTNNGTFINSGDIITTNSFVNNYTSGSFINSGNVNVGTNFTNNGSLTNNTVISVSGSFLNNYSSSTSNNGNLTVANDFQNNGSLGNTNALIVGNNLNNNWSSSITNHGIMAVAQNVSNNGTVTNDGMMEVDGLYAGFGIVDGDGDLCNSDGVTDPTSGAKEVSCNICGSGESSTLPVELIAFNAENQLYNMVLISWTTASEVNNHYFEVLKSKDGKSFSTIARVDGKGNSNIKVEYSINDKIIENGITYYQLKQVDFDGKTEYSTIISVQVEVEMDINIFPNPAKQSEIVKIETNYKDEFFVDIYDISGKQIQSEAKNTAIIDINTQSLKPGIYIIKTHNYEGNSIQKLIVQ